MKRNKNEMFKPIIHGKSEMTTDECMEIFKKYDPDSYKYYYNNMYFFGCDARRYAEYLRNKYKS